MWSRLLENVANALFVRLDAGSSLWSLSENRQMGSDTSDQPRVLKLNGGWEKPNSAFQFKARILVGRDGGATGAVLWEGQGRERAIRGVEQVSGSIEGRHVKLNGFEAEPGLTCDCYRMTLDGAKTLGYFDGTSRAFGDWSGRMSGVYAFENAKE